MTTAPPPPQPRLSIGVTGHRSGNPAFAANRARIEAVLATVLDIISAAASGEAVRLHTLLADGTDHLAAQSALARGWELVAPLPFGRALNCAINAHPATADQARALLDGRDPQDPGVSAGAAAIRDLCARARLFELSDADDEIAALHQAMLAAPGDVPAAQHFATRVSQRVELAGRVMIEQSDLLIGVWDGVSRSFGGGTGHTIGVALMMGAPVVLIDAHAPEHWRVLRSVEALQHPSTEPNAEQADHLADVVRAALHPAGDGSVRHAMAALGVQKWRDRSHPLFHLYRRVEAVFGGGGNRLRSLRQTYEKPEAIASGSGQGLLRALDTLPGADPAFAPAIAQRILQRFAWADGLSTRVSDLYRGGMTANFVASGLAIVVGTAYLPFFDSDVKWIFALTEFLLLCSILAVTSYGRRARWHARWFETRRVAEYLRLAPIMMALGTARAPGHWPKGAGGNWPEFYALQSLREVGLPQVATTREYLRGALRGLLDQHIAGQLEYHRAKARRLATTHANLDRLSAWMFQLAVLSVASYLVVRGAAALHLVPHDWPHELSKIFTFLGVLFPALGGMLAGIRYFGDFDRFAAISEVSTEKLEVVQHRAELLLAAPASALDYASVAELARATDDIVVTEIENWQAVFGGKHITVPV